VCISFVKSVKEELVRHIICEVCKKGIDEPRTLARLVSPTPWANRVEPEPLTLAVTGGTAQLWPRPVRGASAPPRDTD